MPETVVIVSLSPEASQAVEAACALMNGSQTKFIFQVRSPSRTLVPPDLGVVYSWDLLEDILTGEKRQQEASFLFCVLDAPIEDNWFSHRVYAQRTCCITTHDWEYLSDLPLRVFVAYAVMRNLIQILHGLNLFHDETRGCLNDLCGEKPQISFGIRSAYICTECQNSLLHLPPQTLSAVVTVLEQIRRDALGRRKDAPPPTGSLAETVDQEYPFPIAYSFRSMQSELSYSVKWRKLLQLNEVTLKYTTMVLLAAAWDSSGGISEADDELRVNLQRPVLGHWNEACFRTIKTLRQKTARGFLARFLDTIDRKALQTAQEAANRLNHQRNETVGHGFVEEEARYQHLYETHLGDIQTWMGFISPLAGYELIAPTGQGQRRRRVSSFTAKVLMGSHPVFPIKPYQTTREVDTDCLLHDPDTGQFLSLYPWLLLAPCSECYREMVFLYDKCEGQRVVMREYPTNHTKTYEGQLHEEIQKWLTA